MSSNSSALNTDQMSPTLTLMAKTLAKQAPHLSFENFMQSARAISREADSANGSNPSLPDRYAYTIVDDTNNHLSAQKDHVQFLQERAQDLTPFIMVESCKCLVGMEKSVNMLTEAKGLVAMHQSSVFTKGKKEKSSVFGYITAKFKRAAAVETAETALQNPAKANTKKLSL